jgi:hypothetical protein
MIEMFFAAIVLCGLATSWAVGILDAGFGMPERAFVAREHK